LALRVPNDEVVKGGSKAPLPSAANDAVRIPTFGGLVTVLAERSRLKP
jgi:hypothetical protein